jgi:hypothetical protein
MLHLGEESLPAAVNGPVPRGFVVSSAERMTRTPPIARNSSSLGQSSGITAYGLLHAGLGAISGIGLKEN